MAIESCPGNSVMSICSLKPLIEYKFLIHVLSSSVKTISESFHRIFIFTRKSLANNYEQCRK